MKETKQVIFKIGDEEYGIDLTYVSSIDKYENIIYVPNAPQFIEGMINIRGDVIPVYSLRTRFGLSPKEPDELTNIVIVKINNLLVGFLVDALHEIVEMDYDKLTIPSRLIQSDQTAYIDRFGNIDGRMIVLINVKSLLSENEIADIEDIVNKDVANNSK